jgi:hypothetical protein
MSAEADSPDHAVRRLQEALGKRLSGCEVVELDIPASRGGNPWLNYAGLWKGHPNFDAFREAVAEYRANVDAPQQ